MDQTVISFIVQLVSSVGFPIAVALWLLLRTDRTIQELRDRMMEASEDIEETIKESREGFKKGVKENLSSLSKQKKKP